MARRAHFRISARLDSAGGHREGTVTITVGSGVALFTVRPLRSRRTYELSLGVVADMVVQREILRVKKERAAAKLAKRRAKGRRS